MKPKYHSVNGAWPDAVPPLTGPEAITAVKRLWRLAMGRKCPYRVVLATGERAGRYPLRRNLAVGWHREGLIVRPEDGWRFVVHSLSHRCHRRLWPGKPDHDDLGRHAFLEKTMIEHIVNSGWLEGKLKRPEKPKAAIDPKAARRDRVLANIERWEAKQRRARNALKKLHRQRAYYERAA